MELVASAGPRHQMELGKFQESNTKAWSARGKDGDPLCESKAMWEGTSPRVKENKVDTKRETE